MTFGSLFAGIGGMDLGLERAGMECRWQVEIDPFCRRVLEKHWPGVRRYEDVRTVGDELERVDVVCGGFPCQPASAASHRHRRGTAHPAWLWPEMLRVIHAGRPAWVLGENVTALDRGELDAVVSDLEAIGYEVAPPFEVPACAFGYDHWRPRLWILGHADRDRESVVPIDAEVARVPRPRPDPSDLGVEDGLSRGLDACRVAALGNAVVPSIVEWIGRGILAANEMTKAEL